MNKSAFVKGGEWLVKETEPADIFTVEDMSEEQKMIQEMADRFLVTEVMPLIERLETTEPGLMASLLKQSGAVGLLGAGMPEEYGGSGRGLITSTLINDRFGQYASFCTSFACHTGIGSMPILYFGTEAQRNKYITGLASGELIGAYALTEPGSGSDALGAKTTATLSDDGRYYLLNGQKCWITNGGFADLFTVFAKIDGNKLTAFIVERGFEGFTVGPEENKMGIKGSSTVQLYFQDCKVPVENVLGEIGRGHIIAFNILNTGRYKLCALALGGSKHIAGIAVQYAIAREQFNTAIANFGAIQHKLAEMAVRIWVGESAMFRTGKMIEIMKAVMNEKGDNFQKAYLLAAEEYAIECAILKVYGSEVLDFAGDEGLQIHGGNGFSGEFEISRIYRDNRISRIFEGTNEINRLLIVDMILKRAMKGSLDLMGPALAVSKELMSIPDFSEENDAAFAREIKYVRQFKKAILLVAGAAVQKLMMKFEKEQEVIMSIADMMIDAYTAESALLRVLKLAEKQGVDAIPLQADIMRIYVHDAADRIHKAGKNALNRFAEGDELRMMHIGLKRFTKVDPFDAIGARRRIAEKMMIEKRYCF